MPTEPAATARRGDEVPFQAHVDLLDFFLARRAQIVERIQGLLNAQRKPAHFLQDVPLLARLFEECFFTLAGVTQDQARLRRQLDEAHWASGFKPRETPGLHNDVVDPAEMMSRAFHLWQQTRWPGRPARLRYANTLFNLYLLRRLMLLGMRLWDAGPAGAADRLARVQGVLDALWQSAPADQPVLVRDVRWLIPVAQSPTTNELAGYFEVAEKVAESLSDEDRLEIHKAGVRMAGGHLTSQLRHVSVQKGVSLEDHALVLSTRTSNALDLALLIQWLVPLLKAYEHARDAGDDRQKLELAGAICQGISPDPELFVNRLDLLGPYSMIEHLFITTDADGHAAYTPTGRRHLRLLEAYEALIERLAATLHADCRHFKPVAGGYSPYGTLYGFSSRLLEHMALKTLTPDAVTRFSLEDVFTDEPDADKLAWVSGWRQLPHVPREVAKLFAFPHEFAEKIFARIERALHLRVADAEASAAVRTGRVFLVPDGDPETSPIPDLPAQYFRSSDGEIVARREAEPCDETRLLHSRLEGEFLLSYATSNGWLAISKDALTEVMGAGRDAKIVGLPRAAAGVLQLMCSNLCGSTLPQADSAARPHEGR